MEKRVVKKLVHLLEHDLTNYMNLTTESMGKLLLEESGKTLASKELDTYLGDAEKRKRIHIIMPMDMELATYSGYDGKTVYQKDERGQPGYWCYENEGKREWVSLNMREVKKLEQYKDQVKSTNNFCKSSPGLALPFFHYDPRRWQGMPCETWSGSWDKPFEYLVQTSSSTNRLSEYTAIGFKMYTALGYRPDDYKDRMVQSRSGYKQRKKLDGRLPSLAEFYAKCQMHQIPIICHGSRGGVFAHDYMLYYDYIFPADEVSEAEKMDFFEEICVSPWAWENVLRDFPGLYLCLAHFGGEESWCDDLSKPDNWVRKLVELMERYENFYVDLSYFIFNENDKCHKLERLVKEHPKIKKKLLFGTDWYMTLVALGGKSYRSFCEDAWKAFMEIPDGEKLWVNCTFLNPFTFYGIYEKDPQSGVSKLENIAAALDTAKCDRTKLQDNLSFFKRLQKEYDKLVDERKKAKGV